MRLLRLSCRIVMSVVCVGFSICSPVAAGSLGDELQPLIDAHQGDVGVAITNLKTSESFTHRAESPMPTASLIKLPLMIATYQASNDGKVALDQKISLKEDDKVPGSGILTQHFSAGTTISLRDAMQLMIVYSDNTATNLVIDQVGLPATAALMEQLGCQHTKLHSKVYRRDTSIFPKRSEQFGLGSTSAADMVRLLKGLHEGTLVSPAACEQMMAHLYQCTDRSMCARDLPSGTKFAHKSGAVSAVRTDAGIIDSPGGPIAVCVLTASNEDQRWTDDNAAQVLGGKIARIAYDYFNPESTSAKSADPKLLAIGANGRLVEALQRTLNARSKPSPGIAVDGDFGPNTQRAVQAFQRAHNLPDTGQVDANTWAALGPLVEEDLNLPSPDEINSRHVEKQPADSLDGRPFVTCKAWAIGDANTGKLLWGMNEDQPLDIASTTKVMTAYLVVRLAAQHPEVLEETVTFSRRADDTIGSTSGVRAGEQLTVGELLYGLMLPSGNDASVALAEHFGARLTEGGAASSKQDSYQLFVAAMNRQAQALGMNETSYENTSGLTAPNHKSSARDLVTLAYHAMELPLFRKIVGTVQHGSTVEGAEGYSRNLVWRNTNRLLRIEGYDGVKTGTTGAAGSCLVSRGRHDDQAVLLVVLGATSGDARYSDSRNLYRWAWQQLGSKD